MDLRLSLLKCTNHSAGASSYKYFSYIDRLRLLCGFSIYSCWHPHTFDALSYDVMFVTIMKVKVKRLLIVTFDLYSRRNRYFFLNSTHFYHFTKFKLGNEMGWLDISTKVCPFPHIFGMPSTINPLNCCIRSIRISMLVECSFT